MVVKKLVSTSSDTDGYLMTWVTVVAIEPTSRKLESSESHVLRLRY